MRVPLHPTKTWPSRSHRLAQSICEGSDECQYEPKVVGNNRRVLSSGCNVAWRTYSEAVFDAFQQANPDLHYKNHHPCVLEAQERNHRCPRPNCNRVRGGALDHDELVRYPDNEKLIISHPYPVEHNYEYDLTEWRKHLPEIGLINGRTERSWYFPQASSLIIIGQEHVLDRVNMDYELPLDLAPTGCIRWAGE